MASSSALKMAALLMLALFAGQLLMATPTAAGADDEKTCLANSKCNIECFRFEFVKCFDDYVKPDNAFCIGVAYGFCTLKY
jgi:hypothetical protein